MIDLKDMQEFLQSYRRTIRSELEDDFNYAISTLSEDDYLEDLLDVIHRCSVSRYANHYAQYVISSSRNGVINLDDSEVFEDQFFDMRRVMLHDIMTNHIGRTHNVQHLHILLSYIYPNRKEQVCK